MIYTYKSEIKTLNISAEKAFEKLSDFSQLENLKTQPNLPPEIKNVNFAKDYLSINTAGQTAGLKIVEREPFKAIKLEGMNLPIKVDAQILLSESAADSTQLQLTLNADLPAMLKLMFDSKLRDMVNLVAEVLQKGVE
ncbi:MAG: SRPBCC family protein [Paludibacter sp.]|jgi:hypothetical protein|nr:SRPBCC family protein [Paludibacter sp.]